jgi:hypothetical protein
MNCLHTISIVCGPVQLCFLYSHLLIYSHCIVVFTIFFFLPGFGVTC